MKPVEPLLNGCLRVPEFLFSKDGTFPRYIDSYKRPMLAVQKALGLRPLVAVRIKKHTTKGWAVIHLWSFETGYLARKIEAGVLSLWKSRNALPAGDEYKAVMPQGGWTEVAEGSLVDPESLIAFVDEMQSSFKRAKASAVTLDRPT